MRRIAFDCDGCDNDWRRITIHKMDGTELHFCSMHCLAFAALDDELLRVHINGEDIAAGA